MPRKEAVAQKSRTYVAVFEPAEEGGYVVTVPSLPGVVTEGDTLEEARSMAADAIRCYLEGLEKDGLPLPASDRQAGKIREPVTVALKRA
jgi:antitoxin HicB